MSNKLAIWVVLAVLAVSLATSSSAMAYWPAWPYSCNTDAAWAYGWSGASWCSRDQVPYFALHPPVYYSQPVRRPYGLSPFAWPPVVRFSERRSPPAPLLVRNPYASADNSSLTDVERARRPPLRIVNPYVVGAAETAASPNADQHDTDG